MSVHTFAAVDIGSYDLELKIYQITKQRGIEELDTVRHRLDLGKDTFRIGRISADAVDELCAVLISFKRVMETYAVTEYRAVATSAVREADNARNVLDLIRQKTGLKVRILSNSQQRHLGYKAIASKEENFSSIIEKPTVIVDLGGGSLQLSFYHKRNLITTKSLPWGFVRIREALKDLSAATEDVPALVEDMISKDLFSFQRLYLKNEPISHVIAVGDYIYPIIEKIRESQNSRFVTAKEFTAFCETLHLAAEEEVVSLLDIPYESAAFILPTAIVYRKFLSVFSAEKIYAPGITLDDGVVYDYALQNKLILSAHDFDEDILTAAGNIGSHFHSDKSHTQAVEKTAVQIFNRLKKSRHLEKKDLLLLRIACILHDCGVYVDYRNRARASQAIIQMTELIGTSRKERELIARIVHLQEMSPKEIHESMRDLSGQEQLLVEKLGAVFLLSEALDTTHSQVLFDIKVSLKKNELLFRAKATREAILEEKQFALYAGFFREVFAITPRLTVSRFTGVPHKEGDALPPG